VSNFEIISKPTFNFFKIVLITLLIFFSLDLIFGKFIYKKFIRKNFIDTYQEIYLKNDYDHTLKKDLNVIYGNIRYKLCTDQNGFRTFCYNKDNKNKSYDIALIGDSFTEGVGLSYENSYAGIITKKIGLNKVANLAVSSYSPSIYYLKLKDLISQNYKFKEVIIFVDHSDLVDETLCYKFTGDKIIRRKNYKSCINAGVINIDEKVKGFFYNYLRLTLEVYVSTKRILIKNGFLEKKPTSLQLNSPRSSWTYRYDKKIYNNFEIKESKALLISRMNLVSDLLKKNNVQMSLAVYPWPDTIFYDKTENINYKMWKEFCHLRCKNFYNLNKIFFNKLKTSSKNKVITDYFIEGDFHFNKEGSKIVADEFLKQYSNNKP
jgi:hypothetical protein